MGQKRPSFRADPLKLARAVELKRAGKTYRTISAETGISVEPLVRYFKGLGLAKASTSAGSISPTLGGVSRDLIAAIRTQAKSAAPDADLVKAFALALKAVTDAEKSAPPPVAPPAPAEPAPLPEEAQHALALLEDEPAQGVEGASA